MRSAKVIKQQMQLAGELSKDIAAGRGRTGRVASLATHGIVLGALYTLAWVLRATDESPVEYARKKLEAE